MTEQKPKRSTQQQYIESKVAHGAQRMAFRHPELGQSCGLGFASGMADIGAVLSYCTTTSQAAVPVSLGGVETIASKPVKRSMNWSRPERSNHSVHCLQ